LHLLLGVQLLHLHLLPRLLLPWCLKPSQHLLQMALLLIDLHHLQLPLQQLLPLHVQQHHRPLKQQQQHHHLLEQRQHHHLLLLLLLVLPLRLCFLAPPPHHQLPQHHQLQQKQQEQHHPLLLLLLLLQLPRRLWCLDPLQHLLQMVLILIALLQHLGQLHLLLL
jgi:hypothetical protein